jgi:hypothetical protein
MKKILIIALIFLFSCNQEPELITIDNLYQIEIPFGMIPLTWIMDNEDASLQYGNIFSEKYLMIVNESKSDWINFTKESNYFEEYISSLSEDMIDSFNINNNKHTLSDIYLNDSTAGKLFETNGNIEGISVIWNVIFIEGEDNLYQICFWTLKGGESKINELLSVAKTFKEI